MQSIFLLIRLKLQVANANKNQPTNKPTQQIYSSTCSTDHDDDDVITSKWRDNT